mgnify:CR=1 FL=1
MFRQALAVGHRPPVVRRPFCQARARATRWRLMPSWAAMARWLRPERRSRRICSGCVSRAHARISTGKSSRARAHARKQVVDMIGNTVGWSPGPLRAHLLTPAYTLRCSCATPPRLAEPTKACTLSMAVRGGSLLLTSAHGRVVVGPRFAGACNRPAGLTPSTSTLGCSCRNSQPAAHLLRAWIRSSRVRHASRRMVTHQEGISFRGLWQVACPLG